MTRNTQKKLTTTLLLPCLNEANALEIIFKKLEKVKKIVASQCKLIVIVVNNNSNDHSAAVAKKYRAKVIHQSIPGYGATLRKGMEQAQGQLIIMMDGDNSYDVGQITTIIDLFNQGYEYILGSRFLGKIEQKAMPTVHRYIGNPLITQLTNWLYSCNLTDSQTGFRGMNAHQLKKCTLQTTGMEFASELTIEMLKQRVKMIEFPASYSKRIGISKLKPLQDGLKHIFLMISKRLNQSF
jgi:glycosyltransferase involved in cell wall biosynthesis